MSAHSGLSKEEPKPRTHWGGGTTCLLFPTLGRMDVPAPAPGEPVCRLPSWAPLRPPPSTLRKRQPGNPVKPVCSMIRPHTTACVAALTAESSSPPSAVHSAQLPTPQKFFRFFKFLRRLWNQNLPCCQLTPGGIIARSAHPKAAGVGMRAQEAGLSAGELLNCPRPKS